MNRLRTFLVSAILLTMVASAHALTFVTSRPALGGNDYVDWGVLGPPYTVVSNPFTVNSNNGLGMTVSKPTSGNFERLNQGLGWSGNFSPGDRLIWTVYEPGPLVIVFNTPVFGAGAQIQRNYYGSFTGTISAYDASGSLLGSFNLAGDSNGNGDGSTIFLGVLDTSATIKTLKFDVDNGTQDFAINQLDLVTQGGPVIPEPGTLVLMSIGGLAVGLGRRFRP